MNFIFDTHAHYDDEAFENDREELLKSFPQNNIFAIVNAGADLKSSEKSIEIAEKYDYIYAAVGLHPENIKENSKDLKYLKEFEELILKSPKIVAVGEIGLDYHFKSDNKELQKSIFENQVHLALNYNLPVIVHDREAHGDTMKILKNNKPKGVVHCFSGSLEMAREVINLGMYIGVGGVVTFKNAKNIVEVVENISIDNIVLETDAPYMAPTPFRGKRCNSTYIEYTASKIAEIKNMEVSEVLKITKENALKLFNL